VTGGMWQSFKARLKNLPPAAKVNAVLKAAQMRRDIAALNRHYAARVATARYRYTEANALAAVRVRLPRRVHPAMARPRVFWIGANWNQDDSGFLAALGRMAEVRWAEGRNREYGFRQRGGPGGSGIDPAVRTENHTVLLGQIEQLHRERPVDLVLGQMWTNYISPATTAAIRQLGIPVFNVALDDRLPEHWRSWRGERLGAVGFGNSVDLTLTTCPECCAWYGVEGMPAIFWPMASDPSRFNPGPEAAKRFDVTFIGNRYGIRCRIVDALLAGGIKVEAFGRGWPNGPVGAEASGRIFADSRIILGIGTIGHCGDVYTLKLRDFDATMAGALYITHRNPDLLHLYQEDMEIVCYADVPECLVKLRRYLADPVARQAIAAGGRRRALAEHTWEHRFRAAFAAAGLSPAAPTNK